MPVTNLHRWLLAQAGIWIPMLIAAAAGGPGRRGDETNTATFLAGVFSFASLLLVLGAPKSAADLVTAGRFIVFAAAVAGVLILRQVTWGLWTLFAAALLADLLDGWVARRRGSSQAGAVLDMETDQFATLGLAMIAFSLVGAGPQVLLLPAFRYVWVLAQWMLGRPLHDSKPRGGDNRMARRICALLMALLLVTVLPEASPLLRDAAAWIAVLALGVSYGRDAGYVLRRRGPRAAT